MIEKITDTAANELHGALGKNARLDDAAKGQLGQVGLGELIPARSLGLTETATLGRSTGRSTRVAGGGASGVGSALGLPVRLR